MADRICSLCGTHYKDEKGHDVNDCWGIIHQQLLRASANVRDLEYKLKRAQERISEAQAGLVEKEDSPQK